MNAKSRSESRIGREADQWYVRMLEPSSEYEVEAFETWISADPAHARAYAVAEANAARAARLPRRLAERTPSPRIHWRPAFALGIAGLGAAGALLWMATAPSAPAEAAITNTGPGVRVVRLDDGSSLQLDVGAALFLQYTPSERRIRLSSGRVRFNVTADPNRPMMVEAGPAIVREPGGVFDVMLQDGLATIDALQSVVSVKQRSNFAGPNAVAQLRPGERLRVGDRPVERGQVPSQDVRWPDGRVVFEDAPLSQITAAANERGSPRIRLAEPELGTRRLSAVLDLRDTKALANKLAAALGFRVTQEPDSILIHR